MKRATTYKAPQMATINFLKPDREALEALVREGWARNTTGAVSAAIKFMYDEKVAKRERVSA